MSNCLQPHGLQPTRLLCPWDFPGKSTGVHCHFLLQGIFLAQGLNPGLLHCRQTLYRLSYQGSPNKMQKGVSNALLLNTWYAPCCLKYRGGGCSQPPPGVMRTIQTGAGRNWCPRTPWSKAAGTGLSSDLPFLCQKERNFHFLCTAILGFSLSFS